jgi:hypothetical protein
LFTAVPLKDFEYYHSFPAREKEIDCRQPLLLPPLLPTSSTGVPIGNQDAPQKRPGSSLVFLF